MCLIISLDMRIKLNIIMRNYMSRWITSRINKIILRINLCKIRMINRKIHRFLDLTKKIIFWILKMKNFLCITFRIINREVVFHIREIIKNTNPN